MIYSNDNDPKACAWLHELAKSTLRIDTIDDRSINEVQADDVRQYRQCHFFAGIGGWPLALQLAGFPDDVRVWTGSCPCQPLSCAGKMQGEVDERHLWPEFYRLIADCRPAVIFGEQVAGADGREWLDGVRLDLDELGYAVGAADLCAAGVGSPQVRQRIYWVAYDVSNRCQIKPQPNGQPQQPRVVEDQRRPDTDRCRDADIGMADSSCTRWPGRSIEQARRERKAAQRSRIADVQRADGGFWQVADYVWCLDGTWRPVEPGTQPVADGIPNRMAILRGYGNAIVPQAAAEFVKAFMETGETEWQES